MGWPKGKPRSEETKARVKAGMEAYEARRRAAGLPAGGWPKGRVRGPQSGIHREKLRSARMEQAVERRRRMGIEWTGKSLARELVIAAKARPCTDCGGSFPYWVMDLDHVPERGEKAFNLSDPGRSAEEVQLELAKCDPVCANCHRERTHQRRVS